MILTCISLQNFRNHTSYKKIFNRKNTLFFGDNGVGKTNILESISLLGAGSSLKYGSTKQICNYNESTWGCNFTFNNQNNIKSISIGFDSRKKIIKVDNSIIKSSINLIDHVRILWFTPQMHHLFINEKSSRRKFFDKIISIFNPTHVKNLVIYERFKIERKKLLYISGNNDAWIDIIEDRMARLSIEISKSRLNSIRELNSIISKSETNIILKCQTLESISENDQESLLNLKRNFYSQRNEDKKYNRTLYGPHLADFDTLHDKSTPAKLCSSGEQKSMLLSIILGVSEKVDLLLLDDISSGLDDIRLHNFISLITKKKCQVFFTDLTGDKLNQYNDIEAIHLK